MKAAAVCLLLAVASSGLWCQAGEPVDPSPILDPIDAMFDAAPAGEGEHESEGVLAGLVDRRTVSFTGELRTTAGYTGGVMDYNGPGAWDGLVNAAAFSMNATARLDARLDRTFRIHGALRFDYPELEAKLAELFCDYLFLDRLFIRAGRQNVTWGASRGFPYTNLPAAVPGGFDPDADVKDDGIDDGDSIALKVALPFGASSLTALVLARNGYFADAEKPGFRELGYGALADLSFAGGEIVLGGFYQQDIEGRAYLSASMSVWGIDLHAEGLLTDRLEFGAGGGLLWEAWQSRFLLSAEYFFEGETAELKVIGMETALPRGHTTVLRVGLKDVPFRKSRLGVEWKHSFSDGSGTVIPALTVDALAHLRLSAAMPLVYGPDTGYFARAVVNPDPRDRRLVLALLATLSGSFAVSAK